MNHIENIEIKNFKSIRHARLEGCKRINVLVGPPNVGKSNVLEALAVTNSDFFTEDIIRFEKFAHLFHLGNTKDKIVIQYHNACLYEFEYETANHINKTVTYFNIADNKIAHLILSHWDIDKGVEVGGLSSNSENRLRWIHDFWKQHAVVKPYRFTNKGFNHSVSANELISPNGVNLFEVLRYNSEPRKYAGELLELHGLKLVFDENDQLRVQKNLDEFTIFQLPFAQIADTLQRLIFHITAIYANSNSALLFEEPESHCYEPYIMELTNAIKYDKNNNQFFIVTHSQYVISELLRDEESRAQTNIYLANMENDETKIKLVKHDISVDVYERQLDVFFNFNALWDEN